MVHSEYDIIKTLFEYKDGDIYGKESARRRKESNSRVVGRKLGSPIKSGHLVVGFKVGGIKYRKLVHHVVWFLHYGYWPEMLDHIDRNPKNNKIENLRLADKRLNSINRFNQSNNTSGIRGVSKNKSTGKWESYIKNNGKRHYLGLFTCLGQAIKARRCAEKGYWNDVDF